MIITFKYRLKDARSRKHLEHHAWASNQAWNYCCQIQREAQSRWTAGRNSKWPTAFELINLCSGSSSELGTHSDTISAICRRFATCRNRKRRAPRFRVSNGPKKSLGWVPFVARAVKIEGDSIIYCKRAYRFWKSRNLQGTLKSGCFTQDARGRWYVALECEIVDKLPAGSGQVGIDLGLKTLATCSDGTKVPALRQYQRYEPALARAQRAGNKRRVQAIHAKIANGRRHYLHEWSSKIARCNKLIVVGNISPSNLANSKTAKTIFDASWTMLRNQLRYKASRHGARFVEIDERWTSQTCSSCNAVGGPKGIAGLGIRHWECHSCGASHDRDVNAAVNILRVGLERQAPAEEIPGDEAEETLRTMASA